MEPQVTISLKEYNNLLEIKKGLYERKCITLTEGFYIEAVYSSIDHEEIIDKLNQDIKDLKNKPRDKPWYKRIFYGKTTK